MSVINRGASSGKKSGWTSGYAQMNVNDVVPGYVPPPIVDHNNSNEFAQVRLSLRKVWNTSDYSLDNKRIVTPFRAMNNAGDILSRKNYSCGGTCQSFQSRPGLRGLNMRFGSVSSNCVPSVVYGTNQLDTSVPAAACNVKFVYDGSDYITYLRQKSLNKNYNTISYGGDNFSSTQSVIRRMRRF